MRALAPEGRTACFENRVGGDAADITFVSTLIYYANQSVIRKELPSQDSRSTLKTFPCRLGTF